jgi:hypothetical protein
MGNPWVEHVKAFAAEKKISYGCAMSDPKCKEAYQQNKKPKEVDYTKQLQKLGDLVRSKDRVGATAGFNEILPKVRALEDGNDRDRQVMLLSTLRKAIGKLQAVSK